MAFHYRREPWTSHLMMAAIIGGTLALGATDAFARAWASLVTTVPDRVLLTGGLMVIHTLVFWPLALAFHRVDRTDRPRWIARHRIQSGKRREPPLRKTIQVLLRNQFLFLPLLLLVFGEVLFLRGWRADPVLPSFGVLALEVIGQGVVGTLVFYGAHRLLHRKWWVKKVHRIHHEFRTSSALASEYAHPFEFAVGNFGAMAAGAGLLAPSLASMYLFAVISVVTIVIHHSGYALPFAPWAMPHDWHHYKFIEMFGSTGTLDRWLGTCPEYDELRDDDIV